MFRPRSGQEGRGRRRHVVLVQGAESMQRAPLAYCSAHFLRHPQLRCFPGKRQLETLQGMKPRSALVATRVTLHQLRRVP